MSGLFTLSEDHVPENPPLSRVGRMFVSGPALVGLLALIAATMAVFALFPALDLAVAQHFYLGDNRFVAQTPAIEALRRVLYWVPTATLTAVVAIGALKVVGRRGGSPGLRALLFLAISFAVGPGLLVNLTLKDYSHRPRPNQTDQFDGTLAFRPVGRFDGECERNCSFVSGEGGTAAWMVAPALLAPAAFQPLALMAAAVFAVGVGVLRMAFGAHYLSDTILSELLVVAVVALSWRALFPTGCRPGHRP